MEIVVILHRECLRGTWTVDFWVTVRHQEKDSEIATRIEERCTLIEKLHLYFQATAFPVNTRNSHTCNDGRLLNG
jgi:hypothetical protein